MTQHWQRDEPTFYNFLALERNPLDAPDILAGLSGALMSTDPKSDAFTYVLNLPAGFKGRTDANLASLEFLSSAVIFPKWRAGSAGCYLHSQLGGGGEISSRPAPRQSHSGIPTYPAMPTQSLAIASSKPGKSPGRRAFPVPVVA